MRVRRGCLAKQKISRSALEKLIHEARERDEYKCQSCGCWLGDAGGEVHHIIYRSRGGLWVAANLTLICGEFDNPACIAHWKIHNGRLYCRRTEDGTVEFSEVKFDD